MAQRHEYLTTGTDFVKLLSAGMHGAAGCSTAGSQVPEPSSLLLWPPRFFGLSHMRRRRAV